MNIKAKLCTPETNTPQINKRKAHMNKIRQSLQGITLLHQNVDLVKKNKTEVQHFQIEKSNSRQTSSPDSGQENLIVQSYELFD